MTYALYFSPGACSRVPHIALEEIGEPFEMRLVSLAAGKHRQPDYLALNPKGKVPTLVHDGRTLTENVAILTWLDRRHPGANLLPTGRSNFEDAQVISDLAWCSATIHPLINRNFHPAMSCDLPASHQRIKEQARAGLAQNFRLLEGRLADREWLYGDWSLLDVYVLWCFWRAQCGGFDAAEFPRLKAHQVRMAGRPSVQRAVAREAETEAQLRANG